MLHKCIWQHHLGRRRGWLLHRDTCVVHGVDTRQIQCPATSSGDSRQAGTHTAGRHTGESELRGLTNRDLRPVNFRGDVEDVAHRLFSDGCHHGHKEVVTLPLVFHQGILLRHRPQTDALFEVVHLI